MGFEKHPPWQKKYCATCPKYGTTECDIFIDRHIKPSAVLENQPCYDTPSRAKEVNFKNERITNQKEDHLGIWSRNIEHLQQPEAYQSNQKPEQVTPSVKESTSESENVDSKNSKIDFRKFGYIKNESTKPNIKIPSPAEILRREKEKEEEIKLKKLNQKSKEKISLGEYVRQLNIESSKGHREGNQ